MMIGPTGRNVHGLLRTFQTSLSLTSNTTTAKIESIASSCNLCDTVRRRGIC